jgi:hypothetical protein
MTNEQTFLLLIVAIVVFLIMVTLLSRNRHRIRQEVMNRLKIGPAAGRRLTPGWSDQASAESQPVDMTEEESLAELERLHKLIEDRKQIARNSDISYHLWCFYKGLSQFANPLSSDNDDQGGEWYDVKVLGVRSENGLVKFEFELKGDRYKFVDDEEKQGWRENMKFFSLYLYDDSGRCLIEVPMKMKVDANGRQYSILTGGPKAFLSGGWINDFIFVTLKHKRARNQEIRAQEHQERLYEIEDLKGRFGISE